MLDQRIDDAFHPYKTGFTDEQLYWLGWMASDGYVIESNKTIGLGLHTNDRYIVEQFSRFIGSRKVHDKKKTNKSYTYISSKYMFDYLVHLGITPKKSHSIVVDNRLAQSPVFWRGVFEGDGCISKNPNGNGWNFTLTSSSRMFLNQWCEFIKLPDKYIHGIDFKISKREYLQRIYYILYAQSSFNLKLARKWQKLLIATH